MTQGLSWTFGLSLKLDHVLGHVLGHVLDHVLDHVLVGVQSHKAATSVLHSVCFLMSPDASLDMQRVDSRLSWESLSQDRPCLHWHNSNTYP